MEFSSFLTSVILHVCIFLTLAPLPALLLKRVSVSGFQIYWEWWSYSSELTVQKTELAEETERGMWRHT
jgi:hypothetical protein